MFQKGEFSMFTASALRSTLAGILMVAAGAATATVTEPQGAEPVEIAPDIAAAMTGICTANAALLETLGENAGEKLRAAYKQENASYARRIDAAGFNSGPCATL